MKIKKIRIAGRGGITKKQEGEKMKIKKMVQICWNSHRIDHRIQNFVRSGANFLGKRTVWGKKCTGSGSYNFSPETRILEILDGGGSVHPKFRPSLNLRYANQYRFLIFDQKSI